MDYKNMKWSELRKYASDQGVDIYGKKKNEILKELEGQAEVQQEEVQDNVVTFRSADGRKLEVAINRRTWFGEVIEVPSEVADDVSRILKDGGFIFNRGQ